MIIQIEGLLEAIEDSKAQIKIDGGFTYEILLSSYTAARLGIKIGENVSLYTHHYLEGNSQGNNFTPRLAGFLTTSDKRFFELFTTVKGIGAKKALRALGMNTSQIAAAINDRDAKLLQSLPEIGKRTAETIVVTLHGKVDHYLNPERSENQAGGEGTESGEDYTPSTRTAASRNALQILIQLGENRPQSVIWIDQVMQKHPDLDDPQDIITEVFNLKASV